MNESSKENVLIQKTEKERTVVSASNYFICMPLKGFNYFLLIINHNYLFTFHLIATANPSFIRMQNLPFFYFSGDCNDPNVQSQIKGNFITLMTSNLVLPLFCKDIPDQCNKNTVEVYCGNVTAAERRRKRAATMSV